MCRVLGVARSGYYAARDRGLSQRRCKDLQLRQQIRGIHQESRGRYGSPRVHAELRARGEHCGKKRVERLMREAGLRSKKKGRFRVTTNSDHRYQVAPNLLERRFGIEEHTQADRSWVADLTYIPTREGWLYLAVVLDLATRAVVGWAMQPNMERSLVLRALRMALSGRTGNGTLLHHSDRGVQYASGEYRELLERENIACSMSRTGDCWDNAVAESFFATLEWELIEGADWHTRQEATSAIFQYIEVWYNRKRRHSTLGYRTPVEHEEWLAQGRAA